MSENVKIFVKHKVIDSATGDTRTEVKATIVPRLSIDQYRKVFGSQLSKVVPVDNEGNEMAGKVAPNESPKERALAALRKKAQDMGIKGWATMGEEKLLLKVQELSNKKK